MKMDVRTYMSMRTCQRIYIYIDLVIYNISICLSRRCFVLHPSKRPSSSSVHLARFGGGGASVAPAEIKEEASGVPRPPKAHQSLHPFGWLKMKEPGANRRF